ncbi:MAG: hypothetical protein AAB554_00640 [Patescibacteria group bacterium]
MAERNGLEQHRRWWHELQHALEEGTPAENPDDFASLIDTVLRLDWRSEERELVDAKTDYGLLIGALLPYFAYVRGFGAERSGVQPCSADLLMWVRGWAVGAIMPTPRVQRAVVANLRRHFARLLER